MLKRKITTVLIVFLFIFNFNLYIFANEVEEDTDYIWLQKEITEVSSSKIKKPKISSKCAVAIDRESKTILWGKDENRKVAMASTTKIMTAIILMENVEPSGIGLETTVEVCKEAANIGGSRVGLKTEDEITINDLLYGLMLCSGNDAAIQIAISISGSVENFAKLMNSKAQGMGLKNTHFVTPHGLDKEGHYTTAYELALITDYALNIQKIAQIVSTKKYNININGYSKNISNTNELLGYLDGVNGVKTGFTNEAGRCLVTSINRDEFNVIVVVLGADTKKIRTKDSINLIEYIYQSYKLINLKEIIEEEFLKWKKINEKRIHINKGIKKDIELILENNKYNKYPMEKEKSIEIEIKALNYIEAPVLGKHIVGKLVVKIDNKEIGRVNIINGEEIKKKNTIDYLIICLETIVRQ